MPDLNLRSYGIATDTVTIANGAALSSALRLAGRAIVGLFMPATWTAASLTLQTSLDGTTWYDYFVRIDNTAVAEFKLVTPTAGSFLPFDPTDFAGVLYLRFRSGVTATPVNQGGDRTITLVMRDVRGR